MDIALMWFFNINRYQRFTFNLSSKRAEIGIFSTLSNILSKITGPGSPCERTCLHGVCPRKIQTSMPSYRGRPEYWNFACSKWSHHAFQKAKNKGADQTAQLRRLVCAFIIRLQQRQVFLLWGPYGTYQLRASGPLWFSGSVLPLIHNSFSTFRGARSKIWEV